MKWGPGSPWQPVAGITATGRLRSEPWRGSGHKSPVLSNSEPSLQQNGSPVRLNLFSRTPERMHVESSAKLFWNSERITGSDLIQDLGGSILQYCI